MRCTVVLEFDSDGGPKHRVEVVTLHRDEKSPLEGDVGMTLDEGKSLMHAIHYWLRVSRSRIVGLPMVKANFMVLRMTRPVMRSFVRKWWC